MRIESSLVKLSSQYDALSSETNTRISIAKPVITEDVVDISSSKALHQSNKTDGASVEYTDDKYLTEKQRIARYLLETLFGVKLPRNAVIRKSTDDASSTQGNTSPSYEITDIDFTEKIEKERVDFRAEGAVKTTDGRTFIFQVSASLNRSYYEAGLSINTRIQGKDPLVLNLSGVFGGLTENTFDFDIDADGTPDRIHFVKRGSGILVIDFNNDGMVNDGKEVIGTRTGNAVEELAQYDEDRNGWIDEADGIFLRLSLWEKDETGRDTVTSLKDKGIGAICLSSVQTPFQIKSLSNNYGEVLDSGIFLMENSSASTFHRINLYV